MFRSRSHLGFPRKIVALYLLFCLVAISWLAVGMVVTSHSIVSSRTTHRCLTRLGKTAAALEIEYLRHGTKHLSEILHSTQSSSRLDYCSVVSPEGKILAHTQKELLGEPVIEPTGSRLRWGSVTGIQFLDSAGHYLNEFRTPLVAGGEPIGSLRIGIQQPSLLGTVRETAKVAPMAILVPLLLVGAGALVLTRLLCPVAEVDTALREIAAQPAASPVNLRPLRARDATSLGWNRVVDHVGIAGKNGKGDDLDDRLSEALAERKQNEMHNILQNLSDGIAVTDVQGRITFANRAVAALLASELEDEGLVGSDLEDLLSQHTTDASAESIFAGESFQRAVVSEFERSDENCKHVLRVARQPLESDERSGHVWSVRDVTQQKLSDQMRDQFIDSATHELRTPLSNIKAYAETLATCDTIEVAEQREFCNIINSEVTRLARFVDDLLSISSMEMGSLTIDRQSIEAPRLFEEVVTKIQPLMQQRGIEFEFDLPEKLGSLELDKDKIVAVLVNLLGNAAKYTAEGGRVAMRVKRDEKNLQVAIQDTGTGISEEELPKIFEKFFRSDDPRIREVAGTGLGLSLAREVVRMHDGDITVDSTLDEGSTFVMTISL